MALVLVHADADSATQNANLLPERIAATQPVLPEDYTVADGVDKLESHTEGRILLAKLRGDIAFHWLQFVFRADPILVHE